MAYEGRVANIEYGYALTLPDGWFRLDVTRQVTDEYLAGLEGDPLVVRACERNADPETYERCVDDKVQELLDYMDPYLENGLSLLAFDIATIDSFAPSALQVFSTASLGQSIDYFELIAPAHTRELYRDELVDLSSSRFAVPSGEVVYITYELDFGVEPHTFVHDFYFLAGETVHVVSLGGEGRRNALANAAASLAESFEYLSE